MSLLRQWQLLDILLPALTVLRPVERLVAWNLGHIDDALAVALAYLHRVAGDAGAPLLVFHSGTPPARRPVEWPLAELRGVPREPWLQPVEGQRSRWRPHTRVLESVFVAAPPGPVDLLVLGTCPPGHPGPWSEALKRVRKGGYLFVAGSPRGETPPASDWEATDPTGCLYRKVAGTAPPCAPGGDADGAAVSLARYHERAVLVESYTRLALSLAHRFSYRGERMEDLEQVALVALVKAADRYDPERGTSFGPFAASCITGEIKRHFRDKSWMLRVPRSVQEMHMAVKAARDELTQSGGTSPSIARIAEYLDTTEEAVLSAMEAATNAWPSSLDVPSADGMDATTEIPVTDSGFDESLDRQMLTESIALLSPTERLIIKRVFYEGRTQRQVAEELHVSQMQISRLMTRMLSRMREVFQPA